MSCQNNNPFVAALDESFEMYRDILYESLDTYNEHECLNESEEVQKKLVTDLLNMLIDAYELIFYVESEDD